MWLLILVVFLWLGCGLLFREASKALCPDNWEELPDGGRIIAVLGGPIFPFIGLVITCFDEIKRRL